MIAVELYARDALQPKDLKHDHVLPGGWHHISQGQCHARSLYLSDAIFPVAAIYVIPASTFSQHFARALSVNKPNS